jgi:hypothetical protein
VNLEGSEMAILTTEPFSVLFSRGERSRVVFTGTQLLTGPLYGIEPARLFRHV